MKKIIGRFTKESLQDELKDFNNLMLFLLMVCSASISAIFLGQAHYVYGLFSCLITFALLIVLLRRDANSLVAVFFQIGALIMAVITASYFNTFENFYIGFAGYFLSFLIFICPGPLFLLKSKKREISITNNPDVRTASHTSDKAV